MIKKYENLLKELYPYLNPINIIDENHPDFNKLIRSTWDFDSEIFSFRFTDNLKVDDDLYLKSKRKAKELIIDKVLNMHGSFAYLRIYIEDECILVYVKLSDFKNVLSNFLYDYDELFKIFNESESIVLQEGEDDWEVLIGCKK